MVSSRQTEIAYVPLRKFNIYNLYFIKNISKLNVW